MIHLFVEDGDRGISYEEIFSFTLSQSINQMKNLDMERNNNVWSLLSLRVSY